MNKITLQIRDEEIKLCSCGAKYKVWVEVVKILKTNKRKIERYNYPNMACHCNCGVKWGEHDLEVEINKKDYCVSCGQPNKWSKERGNYCRNCSVKCDRLISIKQCFIRKNDGRFINTCTTPSRRWFNK